MANDRVDLDDGDFRRSRRYLAPHLFLEGEEGDTYPPPSDLICRERWSDIMDLATDVALRTSSYDGSAIARLSDLHSDWVCSCPKTGEAPYMSELVLIAGEEFDALVFNAMHGYYRQAINCLRNALEILTVGAGLAVTNNQDLYGEWRSGNKRLEHGQGVAWLRDSAEGQGINASVGEGVFDSRDTAWAKARYAQLCLYAHGRPGHNNADFWASNGPVYAPYALRVVEAEFRETLALSYLVVRLAWPTFKAARGQQNLLAGDHSGWEEYVPLLAEWYG